jgi:hypothetical protein
MRAFIAPVIAIALLSACAAPAPSTEQLRSADFGLPHTPTEVDNAVRAHLSRTLFDPDSLRLTCGSTSKGWGRDPGQPPQVGYLVECVVNAKNRMGGYAGPRLYVFLLKNSRVMFAQDGDYGRGTFYDRVQ